MVVVHYRCPAALGDCVRSLAAHPPPVAWELLVVDNGEPGEVLAPLSSVFAALPGDVPLTLLTGGGNIGFARGVNRALGAAGGRYFLLLNPDVRVREGTVARLLTSAAHLGRRLGALGPLLRYPDGRVQPSRGTFPTLRSTGAHLLALRRLFPADEPLMGLDRRLGGLLGRRWAQLSPLPEGLQRVDYTTGACVLVPRRAVAATGGLDPAFFLFYEEIDWARRLAGSGFEWWFDPEAEALHQVGAASQRREEDRSRIIVERARSLLRYFGRYRRGSLPAVRALIAAAALVRLAAAMIHAETWRAAAHWECLDQALVGFRDEVRPASRPPRRPGRGGSGAAGGGRWRRE